jgi:hypothetical protein
MSESNAEQQSQEQDQKQEEADFEAGFKGAHAAEAPATTEAADPPPPKEEEPAAPAKDPESTPTVAGLPETQIRELLAKVTQVDAFREEFAKTRDTLHGKIGELNRTLQSLQNAPPGKAGVKVAKEAFKKISELWGEEAASALADDLAGLLPQAAAADAGPSDEAFNQKLEALKREVTMDVERRYLLRQHRDFYEQIQTPEFKLWLATKPADEQQKFGESIDADYLAEQMAAFKKHRSDLERTQEKTRRLEQAVHPRGTQAPDTGLSDEAAFEAGFYGTRSR